MSFPFGKPIIAMILFATVGGAAILFRPSPPHADLTLWLFAEQHARMYRGDRQFDPTGVPLIEQFKQQTGHSVNVNLIANQALDVRLISLFMSGNSGSETPDLAEIEITSVGKYFRPPIGQIGFLPLNSYLEKSGWMHRIVASRFAPWTKGSTIFGIPGDLHPCALTYRKDLFDEAGVDLESVQTWNEYQDRALKFQEYWKARGHPRAAIGFPISSADMLTILLLQQHENLVGSDLSVYLSSEKVIQTLAWYAQAATGPKRIGAEFNPAPGQSARDLANGDICGMITPDWQVQYLKQYTPDMAGKLHMIPLPRFFPDDARTASWGGTMIGITRNCRNPDLAWKLIETLYLNPSSIHARQQYTGILPPLPEYWNDPVYLRPDPYYGGQKIDQLYISLASELPARYVTPYTPIAQMVLSAVLSRATSYARDHNQQELESACRKWLTSAGSDLHRMIAFDQAGLTSTPH